MKRRIATIPVDPRQKWVDLFLVNNPWWFAINILFGILTAATCSEYFLYVGGVSFLLHCHALFGCMAVTRDINLRLEDYLETRGLTELRSIGGGCFFAKYNDERVKGEFIRKNPQWVNVWIQSIP